MSLSVCLWLILSASRFRYRAEIAPHILDESVREERFNDALRMVRTRHSLVEAGLPRRLDLFLATRTCSAKMKEQEVTLSKEFIEAVNGNRIFFKGQRSRQSRESTEVGPSLFQVGASALLSFLRLIEHQSGTASHVVDACLAILCCIHGCLQESNGCWTVPQDLSAPASMKCLCRRGLTKLGSPLRASPEGLPAQT